MATKSDLNGARGRLFSRPSATYKGGGPGAVRIVRAQRRAGGCSACPCCFSSETRGPPLKLG